MLEGDECLLVKGEGICKSAFDCQWIRDEQIHENEWTHCNFGQQKDLICCADPGFTIHDTLDCLTNTEDIFSPETMDACVKRGKYSEDSVTKTPVVTETKTNLSFDKIFYTDEQCKALHEEHQRLESLEEGFEGVANGEDADPGEFPFMAVILNKQDNGLFARQCGGSIITKR